MRRFRIILAIVLTAGAASAHVGTGLDVDGDGNICFTDTIHNRIVRVTSTGLTDVVARDVHTNAVACADDGSIYFGDGDSVWTRTRSGQVKKLFKASILRPGLGEPFAIDRNGNSYFVSHRQVVRITREGFASVWRTIETPFPASSGTFSERGDLYVKSGEEIARVERDGSLTQLARGKIAGVGGIINSSVWKQRTLGLAADEKGNVFVANHRFGRLYRIGAHRDVVVLYDSSYPWVPAAVATRGSDIYVLERPGSPYGPSFVLSKRIGRHRIWRIDREGRKSLVAVVANPTLAQKVQQSGVAICLRAKRTAAVYLVRLLKWSVG